MQEYSSISGTGTGTGSGCGCGGYHQQLANTSARAIGCSVGSETGTDSFESPQPLHNLLLLLFGATTPSDLVRLTHKVVWWQHLQVSANIDKSHNKFVRWIVGFVVVVVVQPRQAHRVCHNNPPLVDVMLF